MASDSRAFRANLSEWVKKVGNQADALARQVCQETSERVVENTPVDTGFLRGSWQPMIGKEALTGVVPAATGGAYPPPDVSLICAGIKAGDVYTMLNGAAYAKRLEYGFEGPDSLGRVYHQAGRYYVRDVVVNFDAIVAGEAAKLGFGT